MITTRLKMMLGTAMLMLASQHALAADPIRFALCMDMTKSYPFITVPYVQGVRDYAALINSKGGIESHPVEIIIVEHGNEPQRGIECYEKMKRDGVMVIDTCRRRCRARCCRAP
jgi:branched-chain amino acid transport system substrate-binding protein